MRAKIQFVAFYIFYLVTLAACVVSVSPKYGPGAAFVCGASLMLFWWIRNTYDFVIHAMVPVIEGMMLLSIILSVIYTDSPAFFYVMGPVLLGYLIMEGGYKYEHEEGTERDTH